MTTMSHRVSSCQIVRAQLCKCCGSIIFINRVENRFFKAFWIGNVNQAKDILE